MAEKKVSENNYVFVDPNTQAELQELLTHIIVEKLLSDFPCGCSDSDFSE